MIHSSIRLFLVIFLSTLAACSGTDATDTGQNSDTTTTSVSDDSQTAPTQIIPDLSESYSGENELVNASLTVHYPAGWVAQGAGTSLQLVSENPDTITADSEALIISITPVDNESLSNPGEISAETLVSEALSNTTGQSVTATTTTIANHPAAFASVSFEGNTAFVYAIHFDNEVFVLLTAIRAGEFTPEDNIIVLAIAETIEFDAGEIPQSGE